ncbi:MAG: F-box protein: endocytic membrane traffic, recycling ReCYcling 1 [Alyxoria varia]|nr:MAG: F-box protein: endocytic membrane traffic, recycling ReCYcling 1 [Alyxoria varia]
MSQRSQYGAQNLRRPSPVGGVQRSSSFMASLKSTRMMSSKSVLPAEVLDMITEYMAMPDLFRFARTSKKMQEMVYDDARWVTKLRAMGCWNEAEARQRIEIAKHKRAESLKTAQTAEDAKRRAAGHKIKASQEKATHVLLDTQESSSKHLNSPNGQLNQLSNGFDAVSLSSGGSSGNQAHSIETAAVLHTIDRVRSVRGHARQEYGRIYGSLAPLYFDLVQSHSHVEPAVFRRFQDPIHQAKMLRQIKTFSHSDTIPGSMQREEALESMTALFENAALREFEQAYAVNDVDGQMRKYAHVLVELNGGNACIDHYIHHHWIMQDKRKLGNPLDCLHEAIPPDISLKPSLDFFQRLSKALNNELPTVHRIFPPSTDVMRPFLDRVGEDVISEYVTTLFDEAHSGAKETYLKVVAGVFEQATMFSQSLGPPQTAIQAKQAAGDELKTKASEVINHSFEPHIDLYLQEELDFFTHKGKAEVDRWEKELTEQEASTESFFMSNINRRAAKADFMTSFKKVLMMPVNVFPTMANKSGAPTAVPSSDNINNSNPAATSSTELQASGPSDDPSTNRPRSVSPAISAPPTTELAAKAAIMNSKLEGISSLFSIEVALSLVQTAKSSTERCAPFAQQLGGKLGQEAREQCQTLFMQLIHIVGFQHIKPGFDKAVSHLGQYKAREATAHGVQAGGVRPLVTFLGLVNLGDLIQQMIDAFYMQELVGARLTERDDFLNPATKEKKKFEQMLDERVAAGLNKGIDVLMDEVEYLCATTQPSSDYNPLPPSSSSSSRGGNSSAFNGGTSIHDLPAATTAPDVGPTPTATQIVDLVSSHTSMLSGSSDKTMLDVFNQEVGLRLFTCICKHLKRQRVSTAGATRLIADMSLYFNYIQSLRNKELLKYFAALREIAQIFLVEIDDAPPSTAAVLSQPQLGPNGRPASPALAAAAQADKAGRKRASTASKARIREREKEIAAIVTDQDRYRGIFSVEEVLEFAERRADWYYIRGGVEKAMYGFGCVIM